MAEAGYTRDELDELVVADMEAIAEYHIAQRQS